MRNLERTLAACLSKYSPPSGLWPGGLAVGGPPSFDDGVLRHCSELAGLARFLVVFGFVLAACLTVVSLGVAMFSWYRGGVRAVILMTVLWGLTNIGWIALGRVGFRHQFNQAGTSGDPCFDLVTLILWTNEMSANDFRAMAWIVGASMGYGVGGGLLMLVSQWRGGVAIGRPMPQTGRSTERCDDPLSAP